MRADFAPQWYQGILPGRAAGGTLLRALRSLSVWGPDEDENPDEDKDWPDEDPDEDPVKEVVEAVVAKERSPSVLLMGRAAKLGRSLASNSIVFCTPATQ